MVYNYKEIIQLYKSDYQLKKAIDNQEIYKLESGIYSDKSYVNENLVVICKKYPNSIITMDSAFYYYNLTDVIPQKTYIVSARDSYKVNNDNIVQTFLPKQIVNKGKIEIKTPEGIINIYDRERLLVELLRKKNQIQFDYYKEIISNYREIIGNLDMSKVEEYSVLFRNANSIFKTVQREVY